MKKQSKSRPKATFSLQPCKENVGTISGNVSVALHHCSADVAYEASQLCFANGAYEALHHCSADVACEASQLCFANGEYLLLSEL